MNIIQMAEVFNKILMDNSLCSRLPPEMVTSVLIQASTLGKKIKNTK